MAKEGRTVERPGYQLKTRVSRQHRVHVPNVDGDIGPVPVQAYDATIDHLVLGAGRQDRVQFGLFSRGHIELTNVLVDRVPEAQDVPEELER